MLASAESEGIHGYDLARQYTVGALGEIIRLEPGMLYHHLKKLDRFGLLTTQVERQSDRPDRQIHTLTEAGASQLHTWLREPVQATREIRLDFLLKLLFTRRLAPERLHDLVQQQRAVLATLAGSLERQVNAPVADADALERRMVLRLRLAQTRAAIDWLESLLPLGDDA
jgi:DNA-binding PadR family transcriptional regulator